MPKYHVGGDDFITLVDVSWNEEWNGTEQMRDFRVEGDKLFIESAPAPNSLKKSTKDAGSLITRASRKILPTPSTTQT